MTIQAYFKRVLLGVVAAVALLYAGDYAVLRARLPQSLSTVTVEPYYAVPQKNGKTEFIMLDPQDQTCTQSIFPHMGHAPCWYLRKHVQQRIDM